jgi:CRISPR system Cascade subunit CasD
MSALLLRLAGPLQAWGASSRFVHRGTEIAPTKSGVIGMLAAARGIRRTEPLTELLGLRFAVRIDRPGQIIRDFQTARDRDGTRAMPLSYRHYLGDAVFVAAVGGDHDLLQNLYQAVLRPQYPLYLGRRSCPPVPPVSLGVQVGTPREALARLPWQVSPWLAGKHPEPAVTLEMLRDAEAEDPTTETLRDEPVTFDPSRREHGWRLVVREHVTVANPGVRVPDHDPMAVLGG